jgi:hypothetical protein
MTGYLKIALRYLTAPSLLEVVSDSGPDPRLAVVEQLRGQPNGRATEWSKPN